MDTLIVYLDKSADKAKLKFVPEMKRGIVSVSDKITHSDIEVMADDILCFHSVLVAPWLVKKQSLSR